MIHRPTRVQGFTLIELLTVIAIIAILTAILFPIAGTVREQARASDCMTHLHQLWVSANMYRQDEGGFPPALLGEAEQAAKNAGGNCDPTLSTGLPWQPGGGNGCGPANADATLAGYLYRDQIRDLNIFRCPDNNQKDKSVAVIAHFPNPVQYSDPSQPNFWPSTCTDTSTSPPTPIPCSWIGQALLAANTNSYGVVCPSDAYGTIDCYTSGPLKGQPKYYYPVDAYDIGPRVDPTTGSSVTDASGAPVYDVHYSVDWTGITGQGDLTNQLKYQNPPDDHTLLAYCTWHQAVAHSGSVPAISMSGTAKKVTIKQILDLSSNIYR